MVHRGSVGDLEPVRHGVEEVGEVKVREVVVNVATPSGPSSDETPKREKVKSSSGTTWAMMGGRVWMCKEPPVVAVILGPLPAWERDSGGTG